METPFDIGSFESMFRQHYRFLCVVSYQVTGNQDAARDIVQEFFLSVWQRRHSLLLTHTFQAYATRSVKNLSISWLQKEQRTEVHNQLYAVTDDQFQQPDLPENFLEKEKMDNRVMQVVDLLPDDRKKIFLSYVVDDLSYAEIAEKYQISVNTVKTQMKRAYAFLKSKIADDSIGLALLAILLSRYSG